LNQYEVAVIYDPDLEIDLEKATSKIEKIIAGVGGKITNTDNWGKRKLAYPIKKQDHGIYVFYTVEAPADSPQKLEQQLNITDEVIRFLVTKLDLQAIAKAEEARAEKAKKAAEHGEPEDEADSQPQEE